MKFPGATTLEPDESDTNGECGLLWPVRGS